MIESTDCVSLSPSVGVGFSRPAPRRAGSGVVVRSSFFKYLRAVLLQYEHSVRVDT
jgi:hypothetical protein